MNPGIARSCKPHGSSETLCRERGMNKHRAKDTFSPTPTADRKTLFGLQALQLSPSTRGGFATQAPWV